MMIFKGCIIGIHLHDHAVPEETSCHLSYYNLQCIFGFYILLVHDVNLSSRDFEQVVLMNRNTRPVIEMETVIFQATCG